MMDLLDALAADVLCLQEVDNYYNFFEPELGARGYDGAFKQRNGPFKADGCATFWSRDKFRLVTLRELELDGVGAEGCGGPDYQTHNVALLILLEVSEQSLARESEEEGKERGKVVCIGNAHLFWDPQYPGLKLAQAKAVAAGLAALEKEFGEFVTVLAGDFNSLPGSPVYSYLTTQCHFVSAYAAARSVHSDPPPPSSPPPQSAAFEPSFTNLRHDFRGTLDYLFVRGLSHSARVDRRRTAANPDAWSEVKPTYAQMLARARMSPQDEEAHTHMLGGVASRRGRGVSIDGVLEMPPPALMPMCDGLPTTQHPSDHLPLACRVGINS